MPNSIRATHVKVTDYIYWMSGLFFHTNSSQHSWKWSKRRTFEKWYIIYFFLFAPDWLSSTRCTVPECCNVLRHPVKIEVLLIFNQCFRGDIQVQQWRCRHMLVLSPQTKRGCNTVDTHSYETRDANAVPRVSSSSVCSCTCSCCWRSSQRCRRQLAGDTVCSRSYRLTWWAPAATPWHTRSSVSISKESSDWSRQSFKEIHNH